MDKLENYGYLWGQFINIVMWEETSLPRLAICCAIIAFSLLDENSHDHQPFFLAVSDDASEIESLPFIRNFDNNPDVRLTDIFKSDCCYSNYR
jgi:hypothetical protein